MDIHIARVLVNHFLQPWWVVRVRAGDGMDALGSLRGPSKPLQQLTEILRRSKVGSRIPDGIRIRCTVAPSLILGPVTNVTVHCANECCATSGRTTFVTDKCCATTGRTTFVTDGIHGEL